MARGSKLDTSRENEPFACERFFAKVSLNRGRDAGVNPWLTPRSHKERTRHGAITRGDDVVVHVRDTSISSPTFSSTEDVGMGSGCREVVVEVVVKGVGWGGGGDEGEEG